MYSDQQFEGAMLLRIKLSHVIQSQTGQPAFSSRECTIPFRNRAAAVNADQTGAVPDAKGLIFLVMAGYGMPENNSSVTGICIQLVEPIPQGKTFFRCILRGRAVLFKQLSRSGVHEDKPFAVYGDIFPEGKLVQMLENLRPQGLAKALQVVMGDLPAVAIPAVYALFMKALPVWLVVIMGII